MHQSLFGSAFYLINWDSRMGYYGSGVCLNQEQRLNLSLREQMIQLAMRTLTSGIKIVA